MSSTTRSAHTARTHSTQRPPSLIAPAAALALAMIAGCGAGSSTTTVDMSAPPDLTPVCPRDGQPVALGGRYGAQVTLVVNTRVPANCEADSCILDADTTSRMLLLVDVKQDGSKLTLTSQPCTFQIPSVTLKGVGETRLEASNVLVQSVKPITTTATLDGSTTCAGFVPDPLPILIGVRLADPQRDAVPRWVKNGMPMPVKLCDAMTTTRCDATMDTGCLCDLDGDGKPGATVQSPTGLPVLTDVHEVYLGLRSVYSLPAVVWPAAPGQVTPGQRFKGTVTDLSLDQSPVGCLHTPEGGGAPSPCLDADINAIVGLNPKLGPSANRPSTFVAVPVPPGETCAQLELDAATIFRNQ